MIMRILPIVSISLLLLSFGDCQAQLSINSSGLNTANGSGSTSISIGQSTYTLNESLDDLGRAALGVQIPFEFYFIYCPEDINQDGLVNVVDFIALNSMFGNSCMTCREDINRDGTVNVLDFIDLNSAYGADCSAGP